MSFPDGFWWGTASSATQVEGAGPHSDWWRWERLGRAPASGQGNEFSTVYAEDFSILAEHGLTHHRLTLDWSRLEPEPDRHDSDAVDRYREILKAARSTGVEIWACLVHLTLPGWFGDDMGGFTDERARSYHWARHVDWLAETFGDLVHGFVPIAEPVAFAAGGHLHATMPPGHSDPREFADALCSVHLANHEAWRLLASGDRPVATLMDLSPIEHGVRSRHPEERELAASRAALVDDVVWGTWIRALRDGVLAVPGRAMLEIDDMAGSFDVIGFSYDHATTIYADDTEGPYPPDATPGPTGHAAWPEGLGLTLRRVADELPGRPLMISSCGLVTSDGRIDDQERVRYLDECIRITSDALDDGIDIRGFTHRTAVDGYEWGLGYTVHSGLFDSMRRPRASAELARRWATM